MILSSVLSRYCFSILVVFAWEEKDERALDKSQKTHVALLKTRFSRQIPTRCSFKYNGSCFFLVSYFLLVCSVLP